MTHSLSLGHLRLEGDSVAGDRTWFRVHPPGLAFDAGRGAPRLAGAGDLFLSHGHLDHSLGVPFVLSHRTLHQSEPTRVFCPAPAVAALVGFVEAAERLEQSSYRYDVRGLEPGDRVRVGRDLLVEAFATAHGVPSLGYHLLYEKRRLRPELRGSSGEELARLRERGEPVDETLEELWLSYCGDTGADLFELEPRVLDAGVLVLECTFLAPGHEERAARYGHLHLLDLVRRGGELRNRHLVLHHLSRRHRAEDLRREIDEKLTRIVPRVHVWGAD